MLYLKGFGTRGFIGRSINYFGHRNWVILLTELTVIFKEFLKLTDVSNVGIWDNMG